MLQLSEFIAKYNGRWIDSDGSPHGSSTEFQCVDLANAWIKNLDLPLHRGNGRDFTNAIGFIFIKNTLLGVPCPGDLIVWNWGKYGHVAIARPSTRWVARVFEQNIPENAPCRLASHSYSGCLGWLHYNNIITTLVFPRIIHILRPANVRNEPNVGSALSGSRLLYAGDSFEAVELVKGQLVGNNDKWYRSKLGNFVWSGNCS